MLPLSIIQKTKTEVLDCIFPKKCVGCRSLNVWFCFDCFSKIIHQPPIRRKVGDFSVYACTNYKDKIIQNLVNHLKYSGVTDLATDGAKLLTILYSAIVTDEGGLTCHASIVSRELGKPCIVGTKIATKVLKDGDMVEVNANHSLVRILK